MLINENAMSGLVSVEALRLISEKTIMVFDTSYFAVGTPIKTIRMDDGKVISLGIIEKSTEELITYSSLRGRFTIYAKDFGSQYTIQLGTWY